MVVGGAWLVWRETDDLGDAIAELSVWRVAVSGLLGVAGTYLIGRIWRSLLGGLDVRPAGRDADAVFFVSQLGKYIPGSVWPVVAQMQFGQRWRAPRRVMLAANLLLLSMVTSTGIIVGALLLPWSSAGGLERYWWLLLLLVPLAATLHPRAVPAAVDRVLALLGRPALAVRLHPRSVLAAAAWALAAWLVLGLHLFVLLTAYDGIGAQALLATTGGIGLAWAAGLAFIPAPAGAGVREAVLVLTFAPLVGTTPAVGVALASRVLLLLADVALAGAGALLRRGEAPGAQEPLSEA